MIPLNRPTLPKLSFVTKKLAKIFESGMITNAKYVNELEVKCARFFGVKYVVAVNTGTTALTLALKVSNLKGEVIIPSFSFTSDGHALLWCGLKPVFVDIDPITFNLDPKQIEKKITKNTVAIMPTHVFGNPCAINEIEKIASRYHLKVIYDGAHSFGSMFNGKSVATYGQMTCFSMTPTKIVTAGEGGLIATNDAKMADKLKLARNNGDSFNRAEEFLGMSGRLNEMSAILALGSIRDLSKNLNKRLSLVELYRKELCMVPGISFQELTPYSKSVYFGFSILVDEKKYGQSRDKLLTHLLKSNIESKIYFHPPLHRKCVYKKFQAMNLPNTDFVHGCILSLPLYSHMPTEYVKKVCHIIKLFCPNFKNNYV